MRSNKALKKVRQFNANSSKGVRVLRSMIEERYSFDAVCVKGEAYVFGGVCRDNGKNHVEKYSPSTKTWTNVAKMGCNRWSHCVSAFMDKVFVIGGVIDQKNDSCSLTTTDSCLQFNTEDYSWKEVSSMNERRNRAACAVFEERIVVSGGCNPYLSSNTVESYDVVADTWTPMPSMIRGHYHHSLVVVKNKLIVIGVYDCEVFDKTCNKFVAFEFPPPFSGFKALSIGCKIYIFVAARSIMYTYDDDKHVLSDVSSVATDYVRFCSLLKLPIY